MQFRIKAVAGRGAPVLIDLQADSAADARRVAASQGLTVLSIGRSGTDLSGLKLDLTRAARFDVVVFAEQLRDLLAAGLSVIEALETLRRGAVATAVPVLESLVIALRNGERLSQAFAAQPQLFPQLLVALVRTSEQTSDLAQALSRFLDHQQRVAELRHRIASVALYPLLLTGVGTLVLAFLLLYVMPRFARVFEGMAGALPWSAQAMLWWSQWLHAYGWWLGAALAASLIALGAVSASPTARAKALRRLFAWGPVQARVRVYFLTRWYRANGMLVEGGIPLAEALRLSHHLLPLAMAPDGAAVERAIREGHSPAAAHASAGMVTPVAEQLMRAGENTGDLGNVLTRIAQFHEAELGRSLERGMRALEPVVMVLVGIGVGAVVVLMYLPIFELAAAIQ